LRADDNLEMGVNEAFLSQADMIILLIDSEHTQNLFENKRTLYTYFFIIFDIIINQIKAS